MIGRTNAGGGGKLKSANGTQAPDSANYMLTVTGLGFRPYAALAVSNTSPASTDGVRGFVCDADGNVIEQQAQQILPRCQTMVLQLECQAIN